MRRPWRKPKDKEKKRPEIGEKQAKTGKPKE
jgi:hypothetical protein